MVRVKSRMSQKPKMASTRLPGTNGSSSPAVCRRLCATMRLPACPKPHCISAANLVSVSSSSRVSYDLGGATDTSLPRSRLPRLRCAARRMRAESPAALSTDESESESSPRIGSIEVAPLCVTSFMSGVRASCSTVDTMRSMGSITAVDARQQALLSARGGRAPAGRLTK